MKNILLFMSGLLFFVMFQSVTLQAADSSWRIWTSKSGKTIEARMIKHDENGVVLEKKSDGKKITVKIRLLSKEDQKFIKNVPDELEEKGVTTVEGIDAHPGKTSAEIRCLKDGKWSYFIYLPKQFHMGRKWPVWFITSAGGGKGGGALNRYKVGADRLGCILALSVQSKNKFADSDLAMETMAKDVYSRFPVIEKLAFSTGMSGGSRMAYLLAERNKNVVGVLACGSGSGVYLKEASFRAAKLRRSTYVYSLIGTNCFNRTEATSSHEKFPKDFRLRFFPGGHAWAGSPYIEEGMARVLGEALKRSKSRDLDKLKKDYAKTMWEWTKEMEKDQVWEAALWAEFLTDFKADRSVQQDAEKLLEILKKDPQVILAKDAEKAIRNYRKKYLKQNNGQNKEKAEKLAEKYKGLPHAELLKKLGDPAPGG